MSNPCINRWGLNSFWHHHWYSDTRYDLNLRHDKLILELIQTYVTYGSNPNTTLFRNQFWFKSIQKPQEPALSNYYRWLTLYSKTVDTTTTYRMRIPSEEIFQTKISVMKFNSWFIVNFYWFQPDKDKNKRARRATTHVSTVTPHPARRSLVPVQKLSTLIQSSHLRTSTGHSTYSF